MPNWCGNKMIIDVSKCEKGNEFEEKLVWLKIQTEQPEDGFFDYLCPAKDYPEDAEGYGLAELYGTKWDIDIPDVGSFDEYDKDFCGGTDIYKDEEDRYVLVFRTAWSPPCAFFDKLMERNEGMTGMLLYCEQGQQFFGAYNSDIEYHYDIGEFCEDNGIKTDSEDDDEDSFWEDEYMDEALEKLGDEVGESYCYVDYGG